MGEKPATGTSKIEAVERPAALGGDWKPDRDALERAEAWFQSKFFRKKSQGGIQDDEWQPLVAACRAWGMPDGTKWRDWLKEQWESARANAVKVLITAKAIPHAQAEAVEGEAPAGGRAKVLQYLRDPARYGYAQGHNKEDIAKALGMKEDVLTAYLDKLTDEGKLYQPAMGTWRYLDSSEAKE